ncbi:MAG: hypothetical protein P8166_13150 [Candidatus Thiodiazotropha sp.]
MIRVNIQGRVFVVCQSRGVTDPAIVGYYVEILEQAVVALLTDESTPMDFQQALEEQLIWLTGELDQTRVEPPPPAAETDSDAEDVPPEDPTLEKEEKKPTGYVPEAKAMPERLKDRRSIMEYLLDNDCITLKLVTPDEAQEYKHNLLGKAPEKSEEELVAALRNVLYSQIRKFIRKHNGGPWANATLQHEVRMDITKTRSLRSLVTLARELLSEREEWLRKTKGSLTGRFFGGRVKMDK